MRVLLHLLTALSLLAQAVLLAPPAMAMAMPQGPAQATAAPTTDAPDAATALRASADCPHAAAMASHTADADAQGETRNCCASDCPCPMACAAFLALPVRTPFGTAQPATHPRAEPLPVATRRLPATLLRPPIFS